MAWCRAGDNPRGDGQTLTAGAIDVAGRGASARAAGVTLDELDRGALRLPIRPTNIRQLWAVLDGPARGEFEKQESWEASQRVRRAAALPIGFALFPVLTKGAGPTMTYDADIEAFMVSLPSHHIDREVESEARALTLSASDSAIRGYAASNAFGASRVVTSSWSIRYGVIASRPRFRDSRKDATFAFYMSVDSARALRARLQLFMAAKLDPGPDSTWSADLRQYRAPTLDDPREQERVVRCVYVSDAYLLLVDRATGKVVDRIAL